ncbi:MAG: MFS transporter [Steroidobacterales bacterium]
MAVSTLEVSQPPERADLPFRQVLAVASGNALEFYDFLTFSFFAIQIGHAFFPQEQTSHGLLYSLATFGVGFVTRPLGGVVIGSYGDRAGRRAAMMLSFTLMGFAILGLAMTPSYAEIGIGAPILLLIFRLLQGFALGGEVGPSTAFLLEAAPPHRRGLYVAFQSASQGLAILIAGVVGFILSRSVSPAALDAWGWRVAFLIGAAVIPVGLYLRRSLPETLHQHERVTASLVATRVPARFVFLSLMVLGAMTIATYVRSYMTTYAQDSLKLAASIAFGATIINGLCGVFACPLSGLISDRIGRKPVMLVAVCMLVVLAVPSFIAMNQMPSVLVVFAATAAMSTLGWVATVPALAAITESLPRAVRSGALAILYAVAIAVFGGSTQFIIKWLIDATGSPLAPAWYVSAALVIGGLAMLAMRESAPCVLRSLVADSPVEAS